jgi:hypothetical protein
MPAATPSLQSLCQTAYEQEYGYRPKAIESGRNLVMCERGINVHHPRKGHNKRAAAAADSCSAARSPHTKEETILAVDRDPSDNGFCRGKLPQSNPCAQDIRSGINLLQCKNSDQQKEFTGH